MNELTAEYVRKLFWYVPETGALRWKVSRRCVQIGDLVNPLSVMIDGRMYIPARVIWLHQTGAWPVAEIDHKDRDQSNNAWNNLRPATRQQNACNRGSKNALGFKGVYRHKKRFAAAIEKFGKRKHLGVFDTPEEAHAAYTTAAATLFGAFALEVEV